MILSITYNIGIGSKSIRKKLHNLKSNEIKSLPQTLIFCFLSLQTNVVDLRNFNKTMSFGRLNNLSLKYQWVPPSGSKYIGIRKFVFVAKTQFP